MSKRLPKASGQSKSDKCCVEFHIPGGPVGFRDYNPLPVSPEAGQKPPTEAKLLPQRKQLAGMD